MLQLFTQSLAFGALLTVALVAWRHRGQRLHGRRIRALPPGQALRCVRPLDLGGP
jgi:hypothetical protein